MPKKVTKKTQKVGDATLEEGTPISFYKDYTDWKKTLEGLEGGAIGVLSGDLFTALKNHVKPPPIARPASPNKGQTGAFVELDKIDKLILSRGDGAYFDEDAETLENGINDIEDLLAHPSLNPQNIMFSVPAKYDKKTGDYPEGVEMKPIYGHYLDDYFKTKHKDNLKGRTSDPSWSNPKKNVATPPMYQALVGGKLVTTGLLDIMEKAVQELDDRTYSIDITTSKPARYLTEIPSFRKALARAISTSKVGESVSVSKVTSKLSGRSFEVGGSQKVVNLLKRYANLRGLVGNITSFSIQLTPAKTKTLIKYYMQSNMQVKTRTLTKSWKDVLVV